MTGPADLLKARYGKVPLIHVGDLSINSSNGPVKEMAFYAARIKSRNLIPWNLLIVTLPLHRDVSPVGVKTLDNLDWVAVYLRSHFELKQLQAAIELDWSKLVETEEQSISSEELPSGMWIKEVREKTVRAQRNKYYVLEDPTLSSKYVVSIESRSRDVTHGTGLKDRYELDMLLNFDNYNIAVEKL